MQGNRHPNKGIVEFDRLGGGMRGGELIEIVEDRLCHRVRGFLRNAVVTDKKVADGGGRDLRALTFIGAGGNGRRYVGSADLFNDFRWDRDNIDGKGGCEIAD